MSEKSKLKAKRRAKRLQRLACPDPLLSRSIEKAVGKTTLEIFPMKPCFCGSTELTIDRLEENCYAVRCGACNLIGPTTCHPHGSIAWMRWWRATKRA